MIQGQVGMDTRDRFTEGADAYRRHRPDYPAALVEWVLSQAKLQPGDLVIDVGCGTGITSRLFARRGLSVIGVDVNTAMLAAARSANGMVRYIMGAVEDLPLKDALGKAALASQAFHWFDLDHALAELARVLAPGATCFAFWNIREHSTTFLRKYEQLLKDWCPQYPVASADETVERLLAHPSVSEPREIAFSQIQSLGREGLLGRARSSSYVVHGVDNVAGFNAALEQLFDTYNENGTIEFRYRTMALAFVPMTMMRSRGGGE